MCVWIVMGREGGREMSVLVWMRGMRGVWRADGGRTDGCMEGGMRGTDGWTDGQMDGWTDGGVLGWLVEGRKEAEMDGPTKGWEGGGFLRDNK